MEGNTDTHYEASKVQVNPRTHLSLFSVIFSLAHTDTHPQIFFSVFFSNLVCHDLIAGNDYNYAAYLKGTEDKCDENILRNRLSKWEKQVTRTVPRA